MTDEQQNRAPVTPEWLEELAGDQWNHKPLTLSHESCRASCPACALNKAAEALREAQDAAAGLWNRARNAEDKIDRLSTELEAQREIADRLAEENRRLREAGEHCLAVFQSQADRGRYPSELIPESEHFLGRQGWQFLTGALSTNPNEET